MEGWISIYRQIQDSWLWEEKPFTKGQAWIDMLLEANHKSNKVPIGNELVEVKRGQKLWSILDMADRWGWSRKKVSNFLNLLESDGMIKQKRTTKYTLITIVNYDFYQNREQQKNNTGTTEEHQKNTNNNNITLSYLYNNEPLSESDKKLLTIRNKIISSCEQDDENMSDEARNKLLEIRKSIFG